MAFTLYKEIRYTLDGIPGENLTDFPKLVSIVADADIASELSGGGGIKFTSADGLTDLAFGLYPSSDLSSGTILARVKLSLLTAASVGDVIARLYYSASESTTEDKAGTVSNSYALFMPLEEDPSGSAPQMLDWVSETNVGTSNGSMTSGDLVAGQVGNALDFDGSDDYLSGPISIDNYPITVSAWIFPTNLSGRFGWLWFTPQANYAGFEVGNSNGGTNVLAINNNAFWAVSANNAVTLNAWNRVCATISGPGTGSRILYVNGSPVSLASDSGTATAASFTGFNVGQRENNSQRFAGPMGEICVSSVVRSAAWEDYAHTDDTANADTFTLGTEQGSGGSNNELAAWYYYAQMQ